MPVLFQKGDVLNTDGLRVFAVPVSTSGKLTGAAVAFAKAFEGLEAAYVAHASATKVQLGDVFAWRSETATVYLMATFADATAKPKLSPLTRAVTQALALAVKDGHSRMGAPRLGAGLDKLRVRRMLETEVGSAPVTFEVFEQFVRKPADADPAV